MDTLNASMHFNAQMNMVLSEHDKKKGDTWKKCKLQFLYDELHKEVNELDNALDDISAAKECLDIANFAMFIYHRHIDRWSTSVGKIFDKRF